MSIIKSQSQQKNKSSEKNIYDIIYNIIYNIDNIRKQVEQNHSMSNKIFKN